MYRFSILTLFFLLVSCNQYVDKPKNLIPQDKMAEIIAELTLNDQATLVSINGNIEAGTRYILKKHKITAKDFSKSHQYYVFNKKIYKILDHAQKIIQAKQPTTKPITPSLKEKNNRKIPVNK